MAADNSPGIGAAGVIGLGLEAVKGEYAAPTKFFPLRSEGLQWQQGTQWRRVIAGMVDPMGAVPGNGHVEGDVDMESLEDVIPYFLACARGTVAKTGSGPYVYEFTPNPKATAGRTMSITIVRNDEVFGYSGIVVGSLNFTVDDGMLVVTWSLLGEEQTHPANPGIPTFTETGPYGAGTYELQIPTNSQIFDADGFSFQVEDNGTVENRLIDRRGAAFISYGERNTQLTIDRDFLNLEQYNEFKNLTEQSITMRAAKSTDQYIEFELPRVIMDAYDVSLGDVGGLVRASVTYQGVHDAATGGAYRIAISTDEDIDLT